MDGPEDTFDECNFEKLDEILSKSQNAENYSFIRVDKERKTTNLSISNFSKNKATSDVSSNFSFVPPLPVKKVNKNQKVYDRNDDFSQDIFPSSANKKAKLTQGTDFGDISQLGSETDCENLALDTSINPSLYESPWNKTYDIEIQDQQNDVLAEELVNLLSIPNFFDTSFTSSASQCHHICTFNSAKKTFLANANQKVQVNDTINDFSQFPTDFTQTETFFGLPLKVKTLISKIKNISQLYEWQEECLNLDSVKNRKNLIYALPTSGGKTLVAEILLLREIILRNKNVLFILPFVSIVQEKVWDLSPFQIAFNFVVEEYAGHKGVLPPKKRRYKNTVFVATIEKAYLIVNQLYEKQRLDEIGLIIVDEIHLIGEDNRGHFLETTLATVLCLKNDIHIVGMSATIGNISELANFLHAEIYTNNFRPVELNEFVKCNNNVYAIVDNNLQLESASTLNHDNADQDQMTDLVNEIIHTGSCLIFCPTKKNCENASMVLVENLSSALLEDHKSDREALCASLDIENLLCPVLKKSLPYGVAYHHSGLTSNERLLIEEAFKSGVINVICCTSTLATGVNLPAQRVIIRSPYVARNFISLSRYKQMVGRAGRAGLKARGDSVLICGSNDLGKVTEMLASPMDLAMSTLYLNDCIGLEHFILNLVSIRVANCRTKIMEATTYTLLHLQAQTLKVNVAEKVDEILTKLISEVVIKPKGKKIIGISKMKIKILNEHLEEGYVIVHGEDHTSILIYNNCPLLVTTQGEGTVKAGFSIEQAQIVYMDLKKAKSGLIISSNLHLLYLVAPNDLASSVYVNYSIFYEACMTLNRDEIATAEKNGITEAKIFQIISGKTMDVPERIQKKFFLALMLNDLWKDIPILTVANKFNTNRGYLQHLQFSAATFASQVLRFCESFDDFQIYRSLFTDLSQRLLYCCQKELLPLMELPAVKKARAMELYNAGFKDLKSVAKAQPYDLIKAVKYLSLRTAKQIINSAKVLSIKKMDELQEEAAEIIDFN